MDSQVFFLSLSVASAQSICGVWAISASPEFQDFNNHYELLVCLKGWSLLVKGSKAEFNSEVVMLKSLNWDFNTECCTQMKIYSGNRSQFYTDMECRVHKICSICKSLCCFISKLGWVSSKMGSELDGFTVGWVHSGWRRDFQRWVIATYIGTGKMFMYLRNLGTTDFPLNEARWSVRHHQGAYEIIIKNIKSCKKGKLF